MEELIMKSKKCNSKSIRLTDEVLAYVESHPGDGFNNKFENLVLDYKNSEQYRKKRVAYYDSLIETRKKQLAEVSEKAESLNHLMNLMSKQLNTLQTELLSIKRELIKLEVPKDA